MADRIVVMDHGVIEQVGAPTEIYREPETLFVADFIGAMNKVPGNVISEEKIKIGELDLDCSPHRLADGVTATVAIRPEDIIPHGPGARSPSAEDTITNEGNTFEARIAEMEFLGSFWRSRLVGGPLNGNELIADFSINAVRRMDLAEGGAITIELPKTRLKVFAAPAGAA